MAKNTYISSTAIQFNRQAFQTIKTKLKKGALKQVWLVVLIVLSFARDCLIKKDCMESG